MPRKSPRYYGTVEYESEGKTYSGTCYVQDGCLTLSTSFGRKTAELRRTPVEALARMLFAELIRESRANR